MRREPLTSKKHLQRAAGTLGGVQQLEGELREALARVVDAIAQAGARQQAAMEALGACARELEARLELYRDLIERRERFGHEAARVNAAMKALLERGELGAAVPQAIADLGRVAEQGKALLAASRERGFSDVAREADGIHQQVLALRRRLLHLAPEHEPTDLRAEPAATDEPAREVDEDAAR